MRSQVMSAARGAFFGGGLALGLLSLSPAGCAAVYPTPPAQPTLDAFPLRRFDRVAEGVYRSGQPTAAQMQGLAAVYGVQTVLKLNSGTDQVPAGVTVLHRQLSAMTEPDRQQLERILDDLERSPKPVLIHCTHGEDRTGLVVALYQLRHGVPVEVAYTDMVRHGFHPFPGVWQAWLHAAGWAPAGS